MAIRSSSVAYIINEEEDGFVAIDFAIIDADENEQQDLSSWEFIDQSDEEEEQEDSCSFDEKTDGVCEENDKDLAFLGSLPSDISSDYIPDRMMESPLSDISSEYLAERIICHRQFAAVDGDVVKDELDGGDDYEEEENEDEDEDEDEDEEEEEEEEEDYDLDDELIPFWVNNKFERQRMRKLGKRACPKLIKSKRLTYNYSRPGCFRGKHGLGLKHSLI